MNDQSMRLLQKLGLVSREPGSEVTEALYVYTLKAITNS